MMRVILLLSILLLLPFPAHAAFEVKSVTNSATKEAWLLESHNLPVVSVKLAFRYGGAAADPADKPGTASLFADMLGRGAGDYDNLAFKKLLEELAIDINFSVDKDHLYVDMRTLSENADTAFRLMALALAQPRFDADELARTREQALAGLAQKLEDPNYLASLTWNALVYAKHPYGKPLLGTRESIPTITEVDMKSFAEGHLTRTNLLVSAVGDITPETLKHLLETYFAGLPEGKAATPPPAFPAYPNGTTTRITKPFPQSVAVFGSRGVGPGDPDYYPASLANYILGGGGFESRLMQEIREKRGLAYSVYTYLYPMAATDVLKGSVGTRNDAIETSIDLLKTEIGRMREGVSAEELAAAKNYLTGSFILSLDSTGSIADYLCFIQMEGLGLDYLQRRNSLIEAVTLEQVNAAAKTLFDPAMLNIVVVGGGKAE